MCASSLRPPSTRTFTANACQAVYDGHQLSFVGGFCASSVSRYALARSTVDGLTVYFRSVATLKTCSRYAVRYGDVLQHSPGQYANPPLGHWNFSSSRSDDCTASRIFDGSMPGSLNASPRSAESSSASERDPRCSAQPYGYSTR